MKRAHSRSLLLLIVAAASLSLVVGIAAGPAQRFGGRGRNSPWVVTLATSAGARVLSLGHEELAADWYWMSGLQYYGHWVNRKVYFKDLHLFLDRAIDLDPRFKYPYEFGAVSVPYHTGGWKWVNVEESSAIIERGLVEFPKNWRMLLQLGFNRGVIGTDRRGAAEAYARAARLPGAPPWLAALVARLLVSADDLDAARDYCLTVLAETRDQAAREGLEKRLKEIEIERLRRALQKLVDAYRDEHGADPAGLETLVELGRIESIPADPLGGEFKLDTNGEVYSTSLWKGVLRVFEKRE